MTESETVKMDRECLDGECKQPWKQVRTKLLRSSGDLGKGRLTVFELLLAHFDLKMEVVNVQRLRFGINERASEVEGKLGC